MTARTASAASERESLELRTADGIALGGTIWSTADAQGAVVLVHGFTGGQDDPALSAVRVALGAAGYDVITFDQRGHRQSEGLCTLGDTERLDVAAAIAAAQRRHRSVVVVGASPSAGEVAGAPSPGESSEE